MAWQVRTAVGLLAFCVVLCRSVFCGQGLDEIRQLLPGQLWFLEVLRIFGSGAVDPGRCQAGAGCAVDVPGVDSSQEHLVGPCPACGGCVFVGRFAGFPGWCVFHGEERFEFVPDARVGEQPLGDLGGAVGQGEQPVPCRAVTP